MKNVKNKLRVVHFPQVGSCRRSFKVDVKDEVEAKKIINVLADQHLWLEKHKIIPNYSNAILVEMFDEDIDEETNESYGWVSYWNDEEEMEFSELCEEYKL